MSSATWAVQHCQERGGDGKRSKAYSGEVGSMGLGFCFLFLKAKDFLLLCPLGTKVGLRHCLACG